MTEELDWHPIIEDLSPRLYRYFCASFAYTQADDLVQITIVRLLEKFRSGQFNPSLGTLQMYAFGIAHYVRLEFLRSTQVLHETELEHLTDQPTSDIHRQLEEQAEVKKLRSAINQLTEVQQQVLHLYLDEELTVKDIGLILKMPEGTVKSHIHRAKADLKMALTRYEKGGQK